MTEGVGRFDASVFTVRQVRGLKRGAFVALLPPLALMVAAVARIHGDGQVIAAGVSVLVLVALILLGLWMGRRSVNRVGFTLADGELTYYSLFRETLLFAEHKPDKAVGLTVAGSRSGVTRVWMLINDLGVREKFVDPGLFDARQLEELARRLGIKQETIDEPLNWATINKRYPDGQSYSQAVVSSADPAPLGE